MTRALAAVLAAGLIAAQPLHLVSRDAVLMGTQAQLVVYAADRGAGLAHLEAALAELERTEQQLSTWRADSAISRFNAWPVAAPWPAEAELCRLMASLGDWQAATGGAFDPAVGPLAETWGVHEGGRIPSEPALADARARSGWSHIDFDRRACTLTKRAATALDAGAFGKGEALDRAARRLDGHAWLIDLGGQVAAGGAPPDADGWAVALAHPHDRTRAVREVRLRSGSLATTGGSERDARVGGVRVGHVLDPRTGRPAAFDGSVVVWHERALVADILSTALYVMGPEEGLAWASARAIAAAFLTVEGGTVGVSATPAFSRLD